MSDLADEVICLHAPTNFIAVGRHYINFAQVDNAEMRAILAAALSDGLGRGIIDDDQGTAMMNGQDISHMQMACLRCHPIERSENA